MNKKSMIIASVFWVGIVLCGGISAPSVGAATIISAIIYLFHDGFKETDRG